MRAATDSHRPADVELPAACKSELSVGTRQGVAAAPAD